MIYFSIFHVVDIFSRPIYLEESNIFTTQPGEEERTWRTCSSGEPHYHLASQDLHPPTEHGVHASPRLYCGLRGRGVFKPQALLQGPDGIYVHMQEA